MADSVFFTVKFYDGFGDTILGQIPITPSLDFPKFISVLSPRIGLSPDQFSVSLISRLRTGNPTDIRTIPITESTSFAKILAERDTEHYLHAIRRTPRQQRRAKTSSPPSSPLPIDGYNSVLSPPERVLLRRDPGGLGYNVDYNAHLRNLEIERQKYLMKTAPNMFGYRESEFGVARGAVYCKVCAGSSSGVVPFHHCVYEQVITGKFVSPAGPIARPSISSD